MKISGLGLRSLFALLLFSWFPTLAFASRVYYIVPGHSDGLLKIGMERSEVINQFGNPNKTYHFLWSITGSKGSHRTNVLEDVWSRENGPYIEYTDILYVDGKVIQIEEPSQNAHVGNDISPGCSRLSDMTREFKHLQLSTYGYTSHETSGSPVGDNLSYIYDDRRQGVGFYFGMLEGGYDNTIKGLIVHRIGYSAIPPPGAATVKPDIPDFEYTLRYLYHHRLPRGND